MEVREAVWAKRWQRDAPDSVAIGSELVGAAKPSTCRAYPSLGASFLPQVGPNHETHPRQRLGSDCVQPGAIKHAPVEAKLEFCRILDSVMR